MPVRLLHNIGESPTNQAHVRANYNTREEIQGCSDRLTFDGIYENVWLNRDILVGRTCLLFVMGDYIGKDNSFDVGMPPERYCTESQLADLVADGHQLAWHTWSHPDLTTLSEDEIRRELDAPPSYRTELAYPYGRFNETVMNIAREMGYQRAWSVTQGTTDTYSLRREYL